MARSPQRPPRPRRLGDRLMSPGATPAQAAVDAALRPLDRMANEMDRKWGYNRLPCLVDPELSAKYGRAVGMLNEAIHKDDIENATRISSALMRALARMDEEATAAGMKPADARVIETEVDGWRFGLVLDPDALTLIDGRTFPLFTLDEIGRILKAVKMDHPMILAAKDVGGTVTAIRPKLEIDWSKDLEDNIPF